MIESYVVKTASVFMGMWGAVNGAVMAAAPDERFNSPQWDLVEAIPGGHDVAGFTLIALSAAFLLMVVIKNRFMAELAAWGIGFLFITLSLAQASAALYATTGGVMGGTSNFFIGMVFMLMGAIVRRRASPP